MKDFLATEPKETTRKPLACPACGQKGRPLPMATVRRLSRGTPDWSRAWFCGNRCPVVYFSENGDRIDKDEIKVLVFQKEEAVERPVCYCFGHSVADVLQANHDDGTNELVEQISAACRRGLDRCEETNPQGRCCLGNIHGVLRTESPSCCGGCS